MATMASGTPTAGLIDVRVAMAAAGETGIVHVPVRISPQASVQALKEKIATAIGQTAAFTGTHASCRGGIHERKLVYRRRLLWHGTLESNEVGDAACLVLLPAGDPSIGSPSSRCEPLQAAPPHDVGAPAATDIRAATAVSPEAAAAEEEAFRSTLRALVEFFRKPSSAAPVPNPEALQMLRDMGFQENRATRALLMNNDDVSACLDWLEQRAFSASPGDLDAPLSDQELQELVKSRSTFMPEPRLLQRLVEMGFPLGKVLLALRASDNDNEQAMVWLFGDLESVCGQQ